MTTEVTAPAEGSTEAFMGKVMQDISGAMSAMLAAFGDRLGLFKDLAANGPATCAELAERTDISERYAREWLAGMASAGYVSYDAESERFALPEANAPIVADEGGPMFFGSFFQNLFAMTHVMEPLVDAFRTGSGLPQSAFPDLMWESMERGTSMWFNHLLVPIWLPAMPEVKAALERGIDVADIGCGSGRALIKLAEAFPNSRYIGYDIFPKQIERARAAAEANGLGERISFVQADVSDGLPDSYDLITTFDVVHDAADPKGLIKAIHDALRPDGFYVCLDVNCADTLEGNVGTPFGPMFYSMSVFYCMSVSLGAGGEGLGTAGLPESVLRSFASEAGFASVERVEIENPFNNLYLLRP